MYLDGCGMSENQTMTMTMTTTSTWTKPAQNLVNSYGEQGFVVARSLFSKDETASLLAHYRNMRGGKSRELDYTTAEYAEEFPRMLHMHRWDETSLNWLLSDRIKAWLSALSGGLEPFAIQTMVYYKDPGCRGQALHQDQLFVRAHPGTSIAAWMALEKTDVANGCLRVAPGSHRLPMLCETTTDSSISFTDVGSDVPDDLVTQPVEMEAGDVMFFHGHLIHGSLPNTTTDRSRVSLIGHYANGDARRIADFYHPVMRMDGTDVEFELSETGGPCGTWVDHDGKRIVEMTERPAALL